MRIIDLLTQEEYKAIAADLTLPTAAFIDGGYRSAVSGKTFITVDPAIETSITALRVAELASDAACLKVS